ncbi:MAG: Fic family protein [Bacteroidales bacterium]|nr:Fic family protein [Bacteroidales bacterium]
MDLREQEIIEYIEQHGDCSSGELFERKDLQLSLATLKRLLSKLVSDNFVSVKGKGKATKYSISPIYKIIKPIDPQIYFMKEIDEREINENYNFSSLTDVLKKTSVFTAKELEKLNTLQNNFLNNTSKISTSEYRKEFERLAIDLSWKSSQIEGNTYTLLETEKLLKDKETASGKTKEEAVMLLNHKDALDFIIENQDYLCPLNISKIEDIHSILVKELGVETGIRKRRVGITGTNYRPLDNEFTIREAFQDACNLINSKENIFEKALFALVLISYIQPFIDGNKRTARIISNAILINGNICPISFRTVDSIDYKKAMLVFYEQNNLSCFKEIFISQFEFAVKTYF